MFKLKSSIIILVLVFIMSFVFISGAIAGSGYVTKQGFLAAFTKPLLQRGLDIYRSGDASAFNRLLKNNQLIFIMKAGLQVYLEESTWSGYIRIRPAGETWSVWTVREAIH
uniref:Uncharacterized protein n=1 Tax=viral metagenome TaxID=1070528 RepID=A0A6M3IM40_9ZZZZ